MRKVKECDIATTSHMSLSDAAKKLGVCEKTVSKWRAILGIITPRGTRKKSHITPAEVHAMRASGMTIRAIAKALGVSICLVQKRLRRPIP